MINVKIIRESGCILAWTRGSKLWAEPEESVFYGDSIVAPSGSVFFRQPFFGFDLSNLVKSEPDFVCLPSRVPVFNQRY